MPVDLHARKQSLEDAFQVFNKVSEQLVGSYEELQSRVARLSRQSENLSDSGMFQVFDRDR